MLSPTIIRFAFVCLPALLHAQGTSLLQHDLAGLLPRSPMDRSPIAGEVRSALMEGRTGPALLAAERLVREEPANAEGPLWLGIAEIRHGDIYAAIRRLMRARQMENSASAAKALGVAYYMARQHRLFEKMMRDAIAKDPEDFAPYYFLGRFYDSDLNDFQKAGDCFVEALKRNPGHFRSHYHLGYTHEARGESDLAEKTYHRALEAAGKAGVPFATPYLGLARLRAQSNRNEEALEYARRAAKLQPDDASTRNLLGKIHAALGRHAEAIHEWEAAASLDPTDSATLYRLYRAYQEAGQSDKARTTLAQYKKMVSVYGTN